MNATQQRLFNVPAQTVVSDAWYTPLDIIDAARTVFGSIDLDPASSTTANQCIQATHFFTVEDDGLSHAWWGNVWVNPPYSNPLPWMEKLRDMYTCGMVNCYIALVPERLGVKWFNIVRDLSSAMCMFDNRIRFVRADGRGTSSPNFGNIAFYGGSYPLVFKREFTQFGAVWMK